MPADVPSSPGSSVSADPSPTEADGYSPGDTIATKYKLTALLARGGMGAVWLAHNEVLRVDVALKLIRREMASAEAGDRLLQEARATARIRHPSIVRVHDFGVTERGDPFIVMEMLQGEALSDVLRRRGRLAPVDAVQLLLPIAAGLEIAHAKGIVHRDLKPDNILLVVDETGIVVPKLVDFGIAKLKQESLIIEERPLLDDAALSREVARNITRHGDLIGSPEYMAPEQVRGDAIDERTDVWALALTLYECIVGTRPFSGKNDEQLLFSILLREPQPLTELGLGDAELWEAIERGLAKIPHERWPSMRAIGEKLALWLRRQGVDSDITGLSLKKVWLGGRHSSRPPAGRSGDDNDALGLSVPPPPASIPSLNVSSFPPPARSRAQGMWVALLVVAVVGAVAGAVWWLGSPVRAATPPEPAPVETAAPASAAEIEEEPEKPTSQPSAPPAPVTAPPRAKAIPRPAASADGSLPLPDAPNF
ncbi:MAG TPA: serine/threonine-protein kinase [Polyangiaceae bacterium]|nr:serine/threonine-protein kinase [Polyangiaceae bacterium]